MGRNLPRAHYPLRPRTRGLGPPINRLDAHRAPPPNRALRACQPVVSVLVSFTPVRHRSPAAALIVFAQARTLKDGGELWCAVLESV